MKLRRFNREGISAFQDWLDRCRSENDWTVPVELLDHQKLTEVVVPEIQIVENQFDTKGEAARYLDTILKPLKAIDVAKDAGLWTWLTLLYLDSVCPERNGKRVVRNDYHYVFEPNNVRHFYRHLLYVSWRALQLAPADNRLILRSPLNTLDAVTKEIMKRLYLTRITCIFEVLDRLYWDEKRRRPRRGITGSKERSGDLSHRFPLRIRQLEKTYDLMSLSADQLIELLGDEFSFARPKSLTLFERESQ
jgi:hypothetical protein